MNYSKKHIKLNVQSLPIIYKLASQTLSVLLEMSLFMDKENNVVLNIGRKNGICRRLGILKADNMPYLNVVDQHLHRLLKANVITRVDIGEYNISKDILS